MKTPKPRVLDCTLILPAFIRSLLFWSLAVVAHAQVPDLTNGGVPTSTKRFNLGPTGMHGWQYHSAGSTKDSRQILVTEVDAGSPADGILQVDDVILGADGTGADPVAFDSDTRRLLAQAIADAEARNPATLKLLRWRAGTTTTVSITLQTLGAYSATAPYNCPKSALILDQGIDYIMANEDAGRFSFGALPLMAADDPTNPNNAARQAQAAAYARSLIRDTSTIIKWKSGAVDGTGMISWRLGHELIVLCEYYLKTGDTDVFPTIEAMAIQIANGQSHFGTMGHQLTRPSALDGSLNQSYNIGYGTVNSAGLPCFYGLLLARECGVNAPEIAPAVERASSFFASYTDLGVIPYGEHPIQIDIGVHESNGKSGLAALVFALEDGRLYERQFYARMATAATKEREYGHNGPYFNLLWAPLGAAVAGEETAAAHFSRISWLLDLARRWDGGFDYNVVSNENPSGIPTWQGFYMSSAALLTYALPQRQLNITGRELDPADFLTSAEASATVMADGYDATVWTTSELVSHLGSWSPVVRIRAATELGGRTADHASLIPSLIATANDVGAGHARIGACLALGKIGGSEAAAALAPLLSDDEFKVRHASAESMRFLARTDQLTHLDTILAATAGNARPTFPIDPQDPLQFANDSLAKLLFSSIASEPKGVIYGSQLNGVDRGLLLPAIAAVATHPMAGTRGVLGNTLTNLGAADINALAAEIVGAVDERAPADKMNEAGVREAGLRALEKFNFAEGVPLCIKILKDPESGGSHIGSLEVLEQYAGSSTLVTPDPRVAGYCQYLIDRYTYTSNAQLVLDAIAADTNPLVPTSFKSIQTVTTDQDELSPTSRWTTLRVQAVDLAKGDLIYTWRKVHGAGHVTITPNGTAAAKDAVAYFDGTPGEYLFEVTVSDSRELTEVYGTIGITVLDSGGNLPPNDPPTATPQSLTVPTSIVTPITLSGTDPEGLDLNYTITSHPSNGTLSGTAPNLFYLSRASYTGADSFTFEVMDSEGQVSSAVIDLTVVPADDPFEVVVYEPFDYPSGESLAGKNGGIGFGEPWPASTTYTVDSPGWTWGGLETAGNRVGGTWYNGPIRTLDAAALTDRRLLENGQTLWFSFIFDMGSDAPVNSRMDFMFGNPDGFGTEPDMTPATAEGIGVRHDAGRIEAVYWKDIGDGDGETEANRVRSKLRFISGGATTQALIVGKIEWGEDDLANETFTLYAPDQALNLKAEILTSWSIPPLDQSQFNKISLRRKGTTSVDEIRFGGSYQSVVLGTVPATSDILPPVPGLISFATPPHVVGTDSITMEAVGVYDPSGVEYLFTCTSGGGHDSGWQSSPIYTDTGLTPGTEYSYTVTARDLSPAQNSTAPSAAESVVIPSSTLVPGVVGFDQAIAEYAVTASGLTVGTVSTVVDVAPAGSVLSQSPAGETVAVIGAPVDLVVSLGPPQTIVPNVVGLAQSAAESALTAANLTLGVVTTVSSETVPAGNVISQGAVAGSSVAVGSPVDLVVSSGPSTTVATLIQGNSALLGNGNSSLKFSVSMENSNGFIKDAGGVTVADLTGLVVDYDFSSSPGYKGLANVIANIPDVGFGSRKSFNLWTEGMDPDIQTAVTTTCDNGNPVDGINSGPGTIDVSTMSEGSVWIIAGTYSGAIKVDATISDTNGQLPDVVMEQIVGPVSGATSDYYLFRFDFADAEAYEQISFIVSNGGYFGGVIVTSIPVVSDTTPPTLASVDIVDDQGGADVVPDTLVTYTLTFSEDIDQATVDASDFTNAGTAPVTLGAINEASPGVFTVVVTPTGAGTLQFAVAASSVITDVAGNPLDTSSAIVDDTTISVVSTTATVPDVVGLSQSAAESSLTGASLAVGVITTSYSDTVPAGDVISQGVDAGSVVIIGTAVDLLISDGPNSPPVVDAGPDQQVDLDGAASWTPAQIATSAWFDASDASTIVESGGLVSQWNDKSGNGNHATQATGSRRPTYQAADPLANGMPSIGDPGASGSKGLNIPVFGAKNVYVVTYYKDGLDADFDDYATLFSGPGFNGEYRVMGMQGSADFIATNTFNDAGTYKNGSSVSSMSGVLPMPAAIFKFKSGAVRTQAYALGYNQLHNTRDWQGAYCEFIFTDGTEDAATEAMIEGYLAHKWGLADSLPAGHPYKSTAPGGSGSSAVANLDGTVSDANSDPLTTAWSVVSGPASVSFGDASAVDTTATFTFEGTYVLELTANDGTSQTADQVTITVNNSGGGDTTPPTLASADIVDDQSGVNVTENVLVTYTVTFSEDIDEGTVSAADFSNAGSSAVTIGTITETSPGVLTIEVTPTNPGTLQLQVSAGAVITDVAGNPLDTTSAIVDDTTITVDEANVAPVWTTNPVNEVDATEDSAYSATLADNASDANAGDNLTFAKISGPAWLSVAANGALSGTPTNSDVGANVFTVSVSDGIATAVNATLNITVINTNDAPVFTADPISGSDATEDFVYTGSISGSATDVDAGDTLTYAKVSGPAWLNVASDGTLSGVAGNADVGSNIFTVSVSDGNGGTDTASLNITVINTNDAPAWTSNPVNESDATEDAAYSSSLAGYAIDIDPGASLTFAKVGGPSWLSVASNGALSGTPTNSDVGANVFTVSVSDGIATAVNATLNITVINTNDAPVFTADPINASDATEDAAYSGTLAGSATDEDAGDTLTYAKVSGPAWLSVAANGALSGTPTNSDAGANAFTVSVSDGNGGSDTAALNIAVLELPNTPPVVDAGADQQVDLDGAASWTPAQIVTRAWFDASDASSIVEAGGLVSQWNDKSGNGNHATQPTGSRQPTYQAADPLANGMPSIGTPGASGSVGLKTPVFGARNAYVVTYYKDGLDADFDDYATLFSGGGFNGEYRVMGTQATADFIATNTFNDVGTYKNGSTVSSMSSVLPMPAAIFKFKSGAVRTQAYALGYNQLHNTRDWQGAYCEFIFTDGTEDAATEAMIEGYLAHKWGLADSLPASHPYKSTAPGGSGSSAVANLDGTVSDADSDPLTTAWSVVSGPASVSFGDASAVDTTATFTVEGTYVLELTANDGTDQTADQVTITVNSTGGGDTTPPTLASADIVDDQGGANVTENDPVIYTVTFSEDIDEGTVSAADFSNAGSSAVSIGAITETSPGVFTVKVTPTNAGTLQLQVSAGAVITDVAGNPLDTSSAIVDDTTITVEEANAAPIWASDPFGSTDATEDAPYSATLADDASDADGDPLTYAKVDGPAWLVVAGDGTLSGTPGSGDVGLNIFTLSVTDGIIAVPVEATLHIAVNAETLPPAPDPMTFASAPAATGSASISMTATTATDPNGVEYYFSCTAGGGNDSGWQDSPVYEDTGLAPGTQYSYTVTARDKSANQNSTAPSPPASATTTAASIWDYADADIPVSGTVSGSYTATQASDNSRQAITEVETGGKPSNRYSYLEHKWSFDVTGGSLVTFNVEAHHTANSEGDHFTFAYSTTGVDGSYVDMLTVTKTIDDDSIQSFALPSGTAGTIHVRVVDSDRSAGNRNLDTLYIDQLSVLSEGTGAAAIALPDVELWALEHPGVNINDAGADLDNDGLSDREEYLWGLSPDNPASLQAIITPLDPETGTFRYTRRNPALTGVIYKVWTSFDLIHWSVDEGAIQKAGAPVDSVETVDVTISVEPSSGRCFVRVEAVE